MSMNKKVYVGPYVKVYVNDFDDEFYDCFYQLQGEDRPSNQKYFLFGLNETDVFGRPVSFGYKWEDVAPINIQDTTIQSEKSFLAGAFHCFADLVEEFEICWGVVEGVF